MKRSDLVLRAAGLASVVWLLFEGIRLCVEDRKFRGPDYYGSPAEWRDRRNRWRREDRAAGRRSAPRYPRL